MGKFIAAYCEILVDFEGDKMTSLYKSKCGVFCPGERIQMKDIVRVKVFVELFLISSNFIRIIHGVSPKQVEGVMVLH